MDYYIVVEGQKQGPFDLAGFMKKVKNGSVTGETLVSTSAEGPFKPASELKDISTLLNSELIQKADSNLKINQLKVKNILADGIELWSKKVIEYSLFVGVILIVAFMLLNGLLKIPAIADYSFVADYIISTITGTLIGLFFYYVLITKRSQEPELKELKAVFMRAAPNMFIFAAILSLTVLGYGINYFITAAIAVFTLIIISVLIFVPFLIVDHRTSLGRSIKLSLEAVKELGSGSFLTIMLLVGINIAAALVPAIFTQDLFMFGLFVSVPLTVSSLSYIYDQIYS